MTLKDSSLVLKFALLLFILMPLNGLKAQFTDITESLNQEIILWGLQLGSGVSFYDYNYDGWDDLTIGNAHGDIAFFTNNEGTLEPAEFSIPNINQTYVVGILWADFDNDGDADLAVSKTYGRVELWVNDGFFNFENISANAGFHQTPIRHMGASWVDYNHDGFLDIYFAAYHEPIEGGNELISKLYKNNGNHTFTDVTFTSGVYVPPSPAFQAVFADLNNDGWEDMYLIIDRDNYTNKLFINNQDGTFEDATEQSGTGISICAMSATVGDYDNDLDLDLFVTGDMNTGNVLLQQNPDHTFNNATGNSEILMNESAWGALWLDFNNDSWQDLFVSAITGIPYEINNRFFRNSEGLDFNDVTSSLNIMQYPNETWSCAMGDLNNDGYYDYAVNNRPPFPARLYQNNGGESNYLSVSGEGTYSNRDAIGTKYYCYTGGESYLRYALSGENLYGQNSNKLIFGLGQAETVDSLIIEWNRGTREVFYNLAINQHHHFIEGESLTLPFTIIQNGNSYICEADSLLLTATESDFYLWNNGDTTQSIYVHDAGTYQVTTTTQQGFEANSFPLVISMAPVAEFDINLVDVTCKGLSNGAASIVASNGTPIEVEWSDGSVEASIINVPAGLYSAQITDMYNCHYQEQISINEPDSIYAIEIISDVSCFGLDDGSVSLEIYGGTPPFIIIYPDYEPISLIAGEYTYWIYDNNECLLIDDFEIIEPELITIELSTNNAVQGSDAGNANATVEGGVAPYSLVWSTGEFGNMIENLMPGDYWLTVTDNNLCQQTINFSISLLTSIADNQLKEIILFPNPFSAFIRIENTSLKHINYKLYDNLGRLLKWADAHPLSENISFPDLDKGHYIFEVSTQHNIQTFNLIKQ